MLHIFCVGTRGKNYCVGIRQFFILISISLNLLVIESPSINNFLFFLKLPLPDIIYSLALFGLSSAAPKHILPPFERYGHPN